MRAHAPVGPRADDRGTVAVHDRDWTVIKFDLGTLNAIQKGAEARGLGRGDGVRAQRTGVALDDARFDFAGICVVVVGSADVRSMLDCAEHGIVVLRDSPQRVQQHVACRLSGVKLGT